MPAVAGLCSGYVLHTVLMVAGLAALLAGLPGLLGWITVAGAAYLLWLGAGTIGPGAERASPSRTPSENPGRNQLRAFLQGMGTSGINPKGLLFFVALVPQFVSAEAPLPVPVQSGLLGLTFVLLAAVVYTCRGPAVPEAAPVPAGGRPPGDAGQRDHHGVPRRRAARPSSCCPSSRSG